MRFLTNFQQILQIYIYIFILPYIKHYLGSKSDKLLQHMTFYF